ncbi:MAG: hypothetical protein L0154_00205 [Chloroflexi bacterium]|nr:hypothetical protein [Chloroflexota bacterium]
MKKSFLIFLLFLVFPSPISIETIQSQGANVRILGGPGRAVLDSWSPNGSRLAIHSSYDLTLYDDELDEVETILLPGITNVQWSPSSKFLAFTYTIAEGQNRAVIWDVESESIYMELGDNIQHVWHPTEDVIITYQNNHASLIDITTTDEKRTFTFDEGQAITDVYWGANSQQILFAIAGNVDTFYQLRDLESGEALDTFTPSRVEGEFFDIVWSSETRQFLRYSANDREIEVMDIATSEIVNAFPVDDPMRFSFDKNHLRVAYAKEDHSIEVIDLTSGDSIVLNGHTDAVGELAWNSDHYLATSGNDGHIIVWDIGSVDIVFEFNLYTDPYSGLAWHPDGNKLAVVNENSFMAWINVRQGVITFAGNHFSTEIDTMNWSQDGNYIVRSM